MAAILDKNLSYKGHINHIATTVNNKTCTLRQIGHLLRPQTIIMLYKSLILSHIDYAAMVWGSASDTEPQPLQDLQTKTLIQLKKLIVGSVDRITVTERIKAPFLVSILEGEPL